MNKRRERGSKEENLESRKDQKALEQCNLVFPSREFPSGNNTDLFRWNYQSQPAIRNCKIREIGFDFDRGELSYRLCYRSSGKTGCLLRNKYMCKARSGLPCPGLRPRSCKIASNKPQIVTEIAIAVHPVLSNPEVRGCWSSLTLFRSSYR
ncbi:hypothetical protein KQX54_008204 [Cotesia glomerata]|uniref:Uncharacterized protein n=1 Tax=Cotesia glomerata TaxID=32391 RepID=A0AAV7J1T2_COTGL|nr:hypothetical protein KQX54_008204 [Cotesia glomerata]